MRSCCRKRARLFLPAERPVNFQLSKGLPGRVAPAFRRHLARPTLSHQLAPHNLRELNLCERAGDATRVRTCDARIALMILIILIAAAAVDTLAESLAANLVGSARADREYRFWHPEP